jgi:VWFA-related protein
MGPHGTNTQSLVVGNIPHPCRFGWPTKATPMNMKLMRFLLSCSAALLVLTVSLPATPRMATRTIYVSALTKNVPVTDMTAADFVVKEEGKVRDIATAQIATTPMSIALMLDNGGLSLGAVRQGAGLFIEALQGRAEFAIFSISGRKLTVVDFTRDIPALYAGLQTLLARNTTTVDVLDGFVEVAGALAARKAERPVIVLVATEGDEISNTRGTVVLEAIQRSGARVYHVGLGPPVTSGTRGGVNRPADSTEFESANRNAVLAAAPKNSGGRTETALQANGITTSMKQFADELAAQYAITYATDLPEARLSVETKRRGVTLRAPARVGAK